MKMVMPLLAVWCIAAEGAVGNCVRGDDLQAKLAQAVVPVWAKVAEPGVTMEAKDGATRIKYNLKPDTPYMKGNYQRAGKFVNLYFEKPLPVTEFRRVYWEAVGMNRDGKDVPSAVELQPMVRDEEGEVFEYVPVSTKLLKEKRNSRCWAEYYTGDWHSGEAGAASHGLCTVSGKVGNSRPDGKLEFLGFRLLATQPIRGIECGDADVQKAVEASREMSGEIELRNVRLTGERSPFSHPFFYADAVCAKPGKYRLAYAVSTDFQGEPVHGGEETFEYRPGDYRRIELKTGPDGFYWIDYSLTAEDGTVAAAGNFQTQTEFNPDTAPLKRGGVPGFMRISGGERGVFARGEEYRFTVAPGGEGKLTYEVYPYCATDVLWSGEVAADNTIRLPRHPKFRAFRMKVDRKAGGKTVGTAEFVFGERTDPAEEVRRAGKQTTREEVKKSNFTRLSYIDLDNRPQQRKYEVYTRNFDKCLSQYAHWVQHYTVCPDLQDFEVLPGVFDFALMDDMMETAADLGCKIMFRFAHSDRWSGPYRWGKFSRQYSYDGTPAGDGIPYGTYSGADEGFKQFWKNAYRAIHGRYRNHVAFDGYYIMSPAGEWIVVDQPWMGSVCGFSKVEQEGFRSWLKGKYASVDELAEAWGRPELKGKDWSDVKSVMPDFRSGPKPDLRREWIDFTSFKKNLGNDWALSLVKDIRSYDTNRLVVGYYGPNNKTLWGLVDYGHNGGNHGMDRRGAFAEGWEKGKMGWITEPIHPHGWAADNNPGKGGWVLDVSIWTMLAQAGGGGANLHVYTYPRNDGVERMGGFFAFDRMEKMSPMLREVQRARLIIGTSDVAIAHDHRTLMTKHRTLFGARDLDLTRWLNLVTDDGFQRTDLAHFPDRRFKLIVPNIMDEVMGEETFTRIVKEVTEHGAKCVIGARTGRYVAERGYADHQLLKAFGITPPKGEWATDGDFAAVALEGNPIFATGKEIKFQTLSKLREEMHSEYVMKNFQLYPYKWIPETDYFGCYPDENPNGKTIARFPGGGAAMTLHKAGKGEVIVYWGLPSNSRGELKGTIAAAAEWAGSKKFTAEVPDFFELENRELKRHYGFFYRECEYGKKRVRFPNVPDGTYAADEMMLDQKLGVYSGKYLRETGIEVEWVKGFSPLKAIRLNGKGGSGWMKLYGEHK